MRCKVCGSRVIFASTNGKRIKIVDEEIDIDCEYGSPADFTNFECGSCSSGESDIEGIKNFFEKINKEFSQEYLK